MALNLLYCAAQTVEANILPLSLGLCHINEKKKRKKFKLICCDAKIYKGEKCRCIMNHKQSQILQKSKNANRTEVQSHGFTWEQELLTNVYGSSIKELKEIKYTSKMDLPAKFNRLDNCDVSVKATGTRNTVCMADCLRIFDAVNSGTPFHMVVVHYVHDDTTNTKKLEEIVEVDLTNSRELLFGSLTREQIEQLNNEVKSVPQKRKPTEEEHKKMYATHKETQSLSGAIYLNIKCNSTQSRLQCSFNKFQDFIAKNPSRVIAKSNTNEFRGGKISPEIASSRRVFKKKTTQ